MTSAREEILERIRRANDNAGVGSMPHGASPRPAPANSALSENPRPAPTPDDDVVALFAERVADYKALVQRCPADEVAALVAAAVAEVDGVLVPDGFPKEWANAIPLQILRSDPGSAAKLDHIEAVVTTSAAGIARTGTIVLDHSAGQGRRALTLVPDLHICLVRGDDITLDVDAAVQGLRAVVDEGRALTWISGPSATSDIELSRVEGVHGPRRLHVIIVE